MFAYGVVEKMERAEVRGEVFSFGSNFWQLRLLLLRYCRFYHTTANQREFVQAIKEWHKVSNRADQPILSTAHLGLHHVQLSVCVYACGCIFIFQSSISIKPVTRPNLWMSNVTPPSVSPRPAGRDISSRLCGDVSEGQEVVEIRAILTVPIC